MIFHNFHILDTYDQCYLLNMTTKSWMFLTKMTRKRRGSASVAINESLFVTGGYNDEETSLKSTEYIFLNKGVLPGPDLPSSRFYHCMVTLPSGLVMIIGGYPPQYLKNAFIFDPNTKLYNTSTIPPLIHDRANAGCSSLVTE